MEKFLNSAVTSLNGGINNSTTSIVVNDGSVLPSTGVFRLLIEDEIVKATARSGNTLTVVRGQEATAATSHADATAVRMIFTGESLNEYAIDGYRPGAYSDLYAAHRSGDMYFLNTNNPGNFFRDTGSAWRAYGPMYRVELVDTGSFSWVNQDNTTEVTTYGFATISRPSYSGTSISMRMKSAPSTPYTVTMCVNFGAFYNEQNSAGICLYDSVGGAMIIFGLTENTTLSLGAQRYNSPTSYNSALFSPSATGQHTGYMGNPCWFRLYDDGTNRMYQHSTDGYHFSTVFSEATNTYVTPDQLGYGIGGRFANPVPLTMNVFHWSLT